MASEIINFYKEFERYVKRPCKRAALSIWPCWGTGRGSFTATFERKIAYLGSSSVDPGDIKSKVWGPSGTLARNRAPFS